MHVMQKYILDRLRLEQPLSYSQMLPKGMESSQFMYHLRLLIKASLVQKKSRGVYVLTHEGKATLEYLSINRSTPVRMPKVVTYTLLTYKNQQILLRKQKEPYRYLLEPIAGKLHFGEDPAKAAQREVFEKLGLKIPAPTFVGVADILINKDNKPLTHMIAYAHTLTLKAAPEGLPQEAILTDYSLVPAKDLVPGTNKLMHAMQTAKLPFHLTIRTKAN